MQLRRFFVRIAQTLVAIIGVVLVIAWYLYEKDYAGYFKERRGDLVRSELQPAGHDSLFSKSWLTLASNSGLIVECGLLTPLKEGRYPVVIVLGGKATGKYAIDYALDIEDVHIVAVDYPYDPLPSYSIFSFLSEVPAIRTALLDMVPSVTLLMDYLSTRTDADTTRIIVLGYSFGAPLVPVITAHDRRPAFAAMVFGGGDLNGLIRHNVRRYESQAASELVALLGGLLLRPLEPLRYANRISPIPLLMINGTDDERIPRINTEQLYDAASEPKKIVWLESAHVRKENVELTKAIISVLKKELGNAAILDYEKKSSVRSPESRMMAE
jgi:hypothetical protein